MKYLIVNADDFGASYGINRGILEAHQRGILTSASLMVRSRWSSDAAALSRTVPEMSLGLHIQLVENFGDCLFDMGEGLAKELRAQYYQFMELTDKSPTHIDSHNNVHRHPEALAQFLRFAGEYELPLREYSSVRCLSKFCGQWGGLPHPEQISVENLTRILETDVPEGITELRCHPGYVDKDFASDYSLHREIELRTLCDPLIRSALAEQSIVLVNYKDYALLAPMAAA
jgi:predicted glycoside hydrolase/deacetylase ChbG (UPF0249 family)